jgi:hypothetical protein
MGVFPKDGTPRIGRSMMAQSKNQSSDRSNPDGRPSDDLMRAQSASDNEIRR